MSSDRHLFNDRSLPIQSAWVGAAVTVALAAAAWIVGTNGWLLAIGIVAGGALATAAAAVLALRTSRALDEISASARALCLDDATGDGNVGLHTASAELRRASLSLRRLVEITRERQRALVARNAALGLQLDHRTHELTTLQDLSVGLAEKSELHELIDEALGALEQTIDYSSASVWARDAEHAGGSVVLLGYRAAETGEPAAPALPMAGMRLSRANMHRYEQIERDREPIIENRARQSFLSWLWSKVIDDSATSALYRATRSWMALPLKFRDDVLGVLRVDHHEQDYFDAERTRLLTAVGSQAALAMRHARLQAQEREFAVLAERNRIARDLHDAVSQTLFAANVIAGTLAKIAAREQGAGASALQAKAAALEKLNRGALAEMRLLMFELRPDALESASLADLLQHSIEALECRGDLSVDRQLARNGELPAPKRVQLYRIAQEALSNVARHSGASKVSVEWTVDSSQRATLRIADNGRGFDPGERRAGHFGLENMRSRAQEIGAAFHLSSTPGQGTELKIELR